jgi:hypothetical protein
MFHGSFTESEDDCTIESLEQKEKIIFILQATEMDHFRYLVIL